MGSIAKRRGVMMFHSPHRSQVQPNALPFHRDNNCDIPITPSIVCCDVSTDYGTYIPVPWYGVRIANVRESPHKTIEVLVVIVMLLIALPSALSAQQQLPEPKPLRFDLTPFIGYRTSMSFPVEPHVMGMNPRVVLDASPRLWHFLWYAPQK